MKAKYKRVFPRKIYHRNYIYVLRTSVNLTKVGIACNVTKRIKSITSTQPYHAWMTFSHRLSNPVEARKVELVAHKLLAQYNHKGEWFRIDSLTAIKIVKEAIELVTKEGPCIIQTMVSHDLNAIPQWAR